MRAHAGEGVGGSEYCWVAFSRFAVTACEKIRGGNPFHLAVSLSRF